MKIVLVKQTDTRLEGEAAAAVRRFLFGHVDGATDQDKRAWRRFIRALHEAGSGEFFTIETARKRHGWRHRKHFALMNAVFNAQERIRDFEQFRLWCKVGCGWVDWMAGPKGGVVPVPKSISYATCEEDELIEFDQRVTQFFRTGHAQHYLFPALSPEIAEQGMERILSSFEKQ